jgi:hypothetical protein
LKVSSYREMWVAPWCVQMWSGESSSVVAVAARGEGRMSESSTNSWCRFLLQNQAYHAVSMFATGIFGRKGGQSRRLHGAFPKLWKRHSTDSWMAWSVAVTLSGLFPDGEDDKSMRIPFIGGW